jgi:hypothetical protein
VRNAHDKQLNLRERQQNFSDSEAMILKWISLLDLHYQANLSREEKLSYVNSLREYDAKRLDESFSVCMHECDFLPRAADVVKRLPTKRIPAVQDNPSTFVPVNDWYEPYTKGAKLHIWDDDYGNRRVSWERYKTGELPPCVTSPHPDEYISWDDAWKKITGIGKYEFMPGQRWTDEVWKQDEEENKLPKNLWGWRSSHIERRP